MKFTAVFLALGALGAELGVSSGGSGEVGAGFPAVFDVQPKGYAKLGVVEEFRAELLRSTDRTVLAYANNVLPTWWYVQDMEDFVEGYTEEQERLQEYACGGARSRLDSNPDKWTYWWHAYDIDIDEDGRASESLMKHSDGKTVCAFASDSRTASGSRLLKANPRIKDVADVIRRNQKAHWDRNHMATRPIPAGWAPTVDQSTR